MNWEILSSEGSMKAISLLEGFFCGCPSLHHEMCGDDRSGPLIGRPPGDFNLFHINDLIEGGASVAEIARDHGVSDRWIKSIITRHRERVGLPKLKKLGGVTARGMSPNTRAKLPEIMRSLSNGYSPSKIAISLKMSHSTVIFAISQHNKEIQNGIS